MTQAVLLCHKLHPAPVCVRFNENCFPIPFAGEDLPPRIQLDLQSNDNSAATRKSWEVNYLAEVGLRCFIQFLESAFYSAKKYILSSFIGTPALRWILFDNAMPACLFVSAKIVLPVIRQWKDVQHFASLRGITKWHIKTCQVTFP